MLWSSDMSEGFLLAATLAGDRDAASGRVRLSAGAVAEFDRWMRTTGGASDGDRRGRIKTISRRMSAPMAMPEHELPDRALALLSPLFARSLAAQWLLRAPAPRAGFQAAPGLRRVLLNVAMRGTWDA